MPPPPAPPPSSSTTLTEEETARINAALAQDWAERQDAETRDAVRSKLHVQEILGQLRAAGKEMDEKSWTFEVGEPEIRLRIDV